MTTRAASSFGTLIGLSVMSRSFLKLVGQASMVRGASALVVLALSVLLARVLGPALFGAYSFALAIVGFLVIIAQLGFPVLTVREVAKNFQLKRIGLLSSYVSYAGQIVFIVSAGIVLLVALVFNSFGASHIMNWNVIIAGLPLVLLLPQIALTSAVLRGGGRIVRSLLGEQFYRPMLFLLVLAIALSVGVPITPVSAMLLHAVACVFVLLELKWRCAGLEPPLSHPIRVSLERKVAWTSTALMFSGVALIHIVNTKFDIMAIGFLMTEVDVGLYAVGVQISQVAAAMLMLNVVIVQPAISRASASGDITEIERQCRESARISLSFALVTWLIVAVLGESLIAIAFGEDYVEVWGALMILIGGQVINSSFGLGSVVLNMRGQERLTLTVTFIAAVANVVLNIALVPRFGLTGAASATVFAMIAWNLILWFRAWQLWGINSSAFSWVR